MSSNLPRYLYTDALSDPLSVILLNASWRRDHTQSASRNPDMYTVLQESLGSAWSVGKIAKNKECIQICPSKNGKQQQYCTRSSSWAAAAPI